MKADYSVVILCGGHSTRMGQDKALLAVGKQTLIEYILCKLLNLSNDILLIGNQHKEYYTNKSGLRCIADLHDGIGPIAGLYSGLLNIKHQMALVIACDMPLIKTSTINDMHTEILRSKADAIMTIRSTQKQPLFAFYQKRCVSTINKAIAEKNYSLKHLTEQLHVTFFELPSCPGLLEEFDLDYPADYLRWLKYTNAE